MTDIGELASEISTYIAELERIEQVLLSCTDEAQVAELKDLKSNIEQLLELTYDTLNHEKGGEPTDDNEDDEYSKFMSEIRELDPDDKEDTAADEHLQTFIGKKCSAPFQHLHGQIYHNAFVCDVPKSDEAGPSDVRVKVMCLTPTQQKMLPCKYYLDNACSFSDAKCRFSHGESVPLEKLKDYVDPDYSLLSVPNTMVLAKQPNQLWGKGYVITADLDEKTAKVRLEATNTEMTCSFGDMVPIGDQGQRSSDIDSDDDAIDQEGFNERVISLASLADDQNFGEWEKYTNKIGSKLMKQMGYIEGNGLGSRGQGRIEPVTAQILPAGKSLDYCMQLREQADGDENLFSVEKKLKKSQKRQEAINKREYERQQKDASSGVFSFLNDQILATTSSAARPATAATKEAKPDFKNHTTKNLNIESLKLAESIKTKSREMDKLRESFGRAKTGTPLHKSLSLQMGQKEGELAALKSRESKLEREQSVRKNTSKLTVF